MRINKISRRPSQHAGLCLWYVLFLAAVISSCSDDNKVQFIGVDDVVWNFDFSKDGEHLFLISAWYRNPPGASNSWYPTNNKIGSYRAPGWELENTVEKPDGEVLHVFSCANYDIFISSESLHCVDEACGCCDTLVVRNTMSVDVISQTEVPFYWGTAQTAESNTYFYRCDQRENELFLWAKRDTISALDGDTGKFVRDYIAQDVGEYWFFEIQHDADRLLLFDRTNDKIWVWRLSTAEHLGTIDVVPGFYDCVIQDADHLVCTGYDPSAQPTATYVVELIDLASLSIERVFPIGNYYPFSHPPIAMRGNRAIVSGWAHDEKSLFMFDFDTGEVTVPLKKTGVPGTGTGGTGTGAWGTIDLIKLGFQDVPLRVCDVPGRSLARRDDSCATLPVESILETGGGELNCGTDLGVVGDYSGLG